jgi:hypothetical protein
LRSETGPGLPRIHLQGELSRRQSWETHFGIWRLYWKALLAIHATVAGVVLLAWWKSWWFLVILGLTILPPIDNFWRWVAGTLRPLFRRQEVDVVIEGDRIGSDFMGRGREWLPFGEIRRVDRFGNVWSVLFDRVGVDIPVSLIDPAVIDRMRELMKGDA